MSTNSTGLILIALILLGLAFLVGGIGLASMLP
jgi:hypothetical protein